MMRILMALPLALAMALGLFTLMAWMVDNGNHQRQDNSLPLALNMVMVEHEQAPQRRQRVAPPPPETPTPPPEAQQPSQSQAAISTAMPMASIPSLGLDTSIHGLAVNAPKFTDFSSAAAMGNGLGKSQQAMPLYRVEPRYPSRALRQGKEGYVVLKFTIDTQGRPIDIAVMDAKPRRLFDKEAIRALRKWKYQPQVVNGTAMAQQGQTVRLEFRLNQ
ncbi:energy transducer TonB [Photobacterium kishitanii]|uniref:energy transducer TonB n=1 Tax=Photobacterium kishitanii TaxID=318456 RepID=UPI000D156130|nr:energy transducer TonB [Photobacterium kishitanii]PSU19397.1 energy transducer TonB [Photobacterium kishitanii]